MQTIGAAASRTIEAAGRARLRQLPAQL